MGSVESKPSQNERIIEYINKHGSITQIEALRDIGVLRLASRISDMKRNGVAIASDFVEVENRYGEKCRVKRYRLAGVEDGYDIE